MKSNQLGSIVLRGKRWYGYYRREVIDPTTNNVLTARIVVRLGLRSQMTKPVRGMRYRPRSPNKHARLQTAEFFGTVPQPSNGSSGVVTLP